MLEEPPIVVYKFKTGLDIELSGKSIFFSCIPHSASKKSILGYFQELSNWEVVKLGIYSKDQKKGYIHSSTNHNGSGFVTFSNLEAANIVFSKRIHIFDGAIFTVRRAQSRD